MGNIQIEIGLFVPSFSRHSFLRSNDLTSASQGISLTPKAKNRTDLGPVLLNFIPEIWESLPIVSDECPTTLVMPTTNAPAASTAIPEMTTIIPDSALSVCCSRRRYQEHQYYRYRRYRPLTGQVHQHRYTYPQLEHHKLLTMLTYHHHLKADAIIVSTSVCHLRSQASAPLAAASS